MNKKISILLIGVMVLLSLSFISSEQQSLPNPIKQNDCGVLIQTCDNCSYVNITNIRMPNGELQNINAEMTKDGTYYNYTYCSFPSIGTGSYSTIGDLDGELTVGNVGFEVTPSGFIGNLGFYLVLIVVCSLVVILGFSISEVWFVVMGGLAIMMLGIYSINYGVAGFRDMFMTWGVGLFEIAVGATLSIGAGIQKLYYD